MGLLGLAIAVMPCAALAQPADLFFERTAMTAADARCGLFTPDVSAALAAGAAQARGAALRAGADARTLSVRETEARRYASRLNCKNPQVLAEAGRVQQAYSGYARVSRMRYPGDVADWRADRGTGKAARWRLAQDATFGGGRMTFGLAGREGANGLVAVADFTDGQTPYGARLVLRDGARTMGPYIDARTARTAPLSRKLPPRGATRAYMAEARDEADDLLLPKGAQVGWAFRFPAAAAQALAELDPREAVAVEFLFSGGVRTAYVEVGDFAAGRAFLQIASR